MNSIETLFFSQPSALSSAQIIYGLLLASLLSLVVAFTYRASLPDGIEAEGLTPALVLLAQSSALVMMVIGNSLARAFSLVGALAIIRFRARIRSPWDISFVFLALVVGIGAGVLAWKVAIIGTAVICLGVLAFRGPHMRGVAPEVRLLRCDVASYEGVERRVEEVLKRFLSHRALEEALSLRFGEMISYRYRVTLASSATLEDLLRELSQIEGVERVIVSAIQEMDNDDG